MFDSNSRDISALCSAVLFFLLRENAMAIFEPHRRKPAALLWTMTLLFDLWQEYFSDLFCGEAAAEDEKAYLSAEQNSFGAAEWLIFFAHAALWATCNDCVSVGRYLIASFSWSRHDVAVPHTETVRGPRRCLNLPQYSPLRQ